ncbi:MAG: beta-propeller domain-containing protein [Patescibacteria group bacterium]
MLEQLTIKKLLMVFIPVIVLVVAGVFLYTHQEIIAPIINGPQSPDNQNGGGVIVAGDFSVAKFTSEQEFKDYLTKAENVYGDSFGSLGMRQSTGALVAPEISGEMGGLKELTGDANLGMPMDFGPERVSETNVQVLGIDEPDVVKTDGKQIYVSQPQYYYGTRGIMPMMEDSILPIPQPQGGIKTIKAWPPAELAVISNIDTTGDLLLLKNNLLVFTYDKLVGYEVGDPQNPKQQWELKYSDRSQLVSARLYDSQVYLITSTRVSYDRPCPLEPFSLNNNSISVPCTGIYHPKTYVPTDITYTVSVIDPATGEIKKTNSFIGSSSTSIVYMSGDNIYVTYSYPGDLIGFFYNMMKANSDIFPDWFIEKVEKLRSYDISLQAKMMEFTALGEQWMSGLSSDEELKIENEMENRMEKYAVEHKRELEVTGIVKIKSTDLSVQATGSVPGQPLNQFSLDEYNNHLRIAITVGSGMFSGFGGLGSDSASDVYILDNALKVTGSVKEMGQGERIYSVRFVGDQGYLVTFRQTDPFYVLDLSNPQKPELKGELKIPGFSSYLHPLGTNRILGVGQESGKVKLSLFDVSDPTNPVEKDKYSLDDYWSEVSQTHHAFLQDAKHNVFFMPGGKGGYVFSYQDDKLALTTAVSEITARRALYLNDYLYIVGNEKLVVLNENTWLKINELDLSK